jgi:hypothetical protein
MFYPDDIDIAQDHVYTITDRELDIIILKMGSLLSILNNKKTNHAKLLIALVQDDDFRKCFMEIADVDSFQFVVRSLMEKYPSLCKSKVVSGALKSGNTNRKKFV